jgi:hypothetical protein
MYAATLTVGAEGNRETHMLVAERKKEGLLSVETI